MTDIVAPPPIDALPPAPLPSDTPAEFDSKAFATLVAQASMVDQVNASNAAAHQNALAAEERAATATGAATTATDAAGLATTQAGISADAAAVAVAARDEAVPAAATAVAARDEAVPAAVAAVAARDLANAYRDQAEVFATQQLKATSASNLTPGAGAKAFAVEPSRSFVVGMYLVATSQGDPGTRMSGYVTAYDSATGALTLDVDAFAGASARADWVIGVAVAGSAGGLASQVVTASTACVANVAYIVAAAGITLTLPASWAPGDRIAITEAIGGNQQYTLDFGATKLRGRAVNSQTIEANYAGSGVLQYQDATRGLV